jgi:hypothetical protein
VVGANPTAQINGPAVNGTATTFMRSDAAPALAQIITPGTVTYPDSLTFDATGRITAASSGTAPVVPPTAANPTAQVSGTVVNGSAASFMRSDAAPPLAAIVTAGSVTNGNFSFDQFGRITLATSGTPGAGATSPLATNTGPLFVNTNNAPTIPAPGIGVVLHLTAEDVGVAASTAMVIDAVGQPIIRMRKAMGSVAASMSPGGGFPANNAAMGMIEIQGHINTPGGFGSVVQLRAQATETWSASGRGTSLQFWTCRNQALAPSTALTISGSGAILVGGVVDPGTPGAISAEAVWVQGVNIKDELDALDQRLTLAGF